MYFDTKKEDNIFVRYSKIRYMLAEPCVVCVQNLYNEQGKITGVFNILIFVNS